MVSFSALHGRPVKCLVAMVRWNVKFMHQGRTLIATITPYAVTIAALFFIQRLTKPKIKGDIKIRFIRRTGPQRVA
jgi:hypothetical protein